ncbi:DEAD/DEAH box helicase [Treponema sp. R8-4-B8]
MNFEQLGVAPCFIKRLETQNIKEATDIQCKVIPRLSAGESVFFTSATGTGKTFAYLLPLLTNLLKNEKPAFGPRILILAPTLELCSQILSELEFLLADSPLRSFLAIRSISLDRQIENIKKIKPDIVVGNPNRLLLLAQKKFLKLNNLYSLIFDEADRLVSGEMIDDTAELLSLIRKFAKTDKILLGACSATINKKHAEKVQTVFFGDGEGRGVSFIESEDNEILRDKIEHWAIFSEKRRKDQTLRSLLAAIKTKKSRVKALVFASKGDEAAMVLSRLQYHHVPAAGLFGKVGKNSLSGAERKEALDLFRRGSVDVLVSTDLAARGLDIPDITHVIALDVPSDGEAYIHRCGRTGRAGKRGIMVTIGDETQMRLLSSLEKKLKIRINPKELYMGQVCVPEL